MAQVEMQQHYIVLQQTIMALQQAVITELQAARRGQRIDIDFSSILGTSHALRSACIDSLNSQYRRMVQAGPAMIPDLDSYPAGFRPPRLIDIPSWSSQFHHHEFPERNPSCDPGQLSSQKSLVTWDTLSICSSKHCLVQYLHNVQECLPSRAGSLPARLSRSHPLCFHQEYQIPIKKKKNLHI